MIGSFSSIEMTSPAFGPGQPIPERFTGAGRNLSPPLAWTDPPPGTRTFALLAHDPDAPRGDWVHWVLFHLPAAARFLPEGVPPLADLPDGSRQGLNDFNRLGYGGPMPPPGRTHRYVFHLYALDTVLELNARATKAELLAAMRGHVLAETQLTGTFRR